MKKDETRINQLVYTIRFVVIGLYIFKFLENHLEFFHLITNISNQIPKIIGLVFSTFLFVWFIYYNLTHALLETKSNYMKSKFTRPFILLFLLYSFILVAFQSKQVYESLFYYFFSLKTLVEIIYFIGLVAIIWRELVYLKRIPTANNN